MSGTLSGGRKAAQTNKERYGEDFYRVQGKKGGLRGAKDGAIKGFAANRELASTAGRLGGLKSKRKKPVVN